MLQEFKEDDDPFAAVIDYYLKGNIEDCIISWRYIVDTLNSEDIEERSLARSLSSKYCQEEERKECKVTEHEEKGSQGMYYNAIVNLIIFVTSSHSHPISHLQRTGNSKAQMVHNRNTAGHFLYHVGHI